jgi:hypothetical protein
MAESSLTAHHLSGASKTPEAPDLLLVLNGAQLFVR